MDEVSGIPILGGGITGLAAGAASGFPVFEACEVPGGICSSYYIRPGSTVRLFKRPNDQEAYRFEIGGGHWIFGGDPAVLELIRALAPVRSYSRRSSVYFPDKELIVPYPIQNHLRYFGAELGVRALGEIVGTSTLGYRAETLADWLMAHFGRTLCELFFNPFHELYTAGLWNEIAPQDGYKTPNDISRVLAGAFHEVPAVGYNATYIYPVDGLDSLVRELAARCDVRYGKRAQRVDLERKIVRFADGSAIGYDSLMSTLPLNRMMDIVDTDVGVAPDPSSSVLVMNIGAAKGPRCPVDHWLYIPRSRSGFHRVGFYSNVDSSFLPASVRRAGTHVSIYVEKALRDGVRPTELEVSDLAKGIAEELRDWGWIEETEALDPTWIDVAYTWTRPGSVWRQRALRYLADHQVYQVGRYGRWVFQGIAESLRDGLMVGAALRHAAASPIPDQDATS